MKTKKFNRKLTLNKKTISDLTADELSRLKGGAFTDGNTCVRTFCVTNCFTCYPCSP